jgi:anti-sigma B factor antagonist
VGLMRFETQIREGVATLLLKGRFCTGAEVELAPARTFLRENGIRKAVIDMSEVPYVDSTGLAFLVDLHKALEADGGQLALAGPNARVREVLALTRIGEFVPSFADRKSAEAALRPGVMCSHS